MRVFRTLQTLTVFAVILTMWGCAAVTVRKPLPENMLDGSNFWGMEDIRFWGDAAPPYWDQWLSASDAEVKAEFAGIMNRKHVYLAISGGGENGAFGAGLLNGWTDADNRPEFTIVSGISTGAIIAPFAFLGPQYDAELKEIYTQFSTKDLVTMRGITRILRGDAP